VPVCGSLDPEGIDRDRFAADLVGSGGLEQSLDDKL